MDVIHLNRRSGFGDARNVMQTWENNGYEHCVDLLFQPGHDLTATLQNLGKDSRQSDFAAIRQAWIDRMVHTSTPFLEKMTLFWHNHFATAQYKVNHPGWMLQQNNTLRRNALGSFRQMLLDITADPAMLIWLDGATSTRKAPNENYGRELMELFTIGLNYTQDDVTAASEAMTGYTLDRKTGKVRFIPSRHNTDVKTFFGDTGNLGPEQIIDDLLKHPACAPFVVTKILQWFVHPNPPTAWVQKFASTFVSNGYHIGNLMRNIFLSDEFLSSDARGCIIKSPVDYVVGIARMADVNIPVKQLDVTIAESGMQLFNPPNVAGWQIGQGWVNSATLLARFNYAYRVSRLLKATSPSDVDGIAQAYQLIELSANTRAQMERVAAQGGADAHPSLSYLAFVSPEFQMC